MFNTAPRPLNQPAARELPPAMRKVAVVALVAAIAAGIICVTILADNLVRGRQVAAPVWLLGAGVPVLFLGQIWIIAAIRWMYPGRGGRLNGTGVLQRAHPVVLGGAVVIFFLGWLSAMTSFNSQGVPGGPANGCAHTLDNHGTITCVSDADYQRDVAAEQRAITGIGLGFFAFHAAGGMIILGRRRPV